MQRPPFKVGQVWQRDAVDTWRVIAATDDGMVAELELVAYAGVRNDSGRILDIDQRNWPTVASWVCVPEVRLDGGKVLR